MTATLVTDLSNEELIDAVLSCGGLGQTACVLVAEAELSSLEEVVDRLEASGVPFFGGLFPGLILGSRQINRGALVQGLSLAGKPHIFQGLDSPGPVPTQPADFPDAQGAHSGIVLVDGLTPSISSFLSRMFDRYGRSIRFVGGGAGSLSLQSKPCLFTDQGIFQDSALVAFLQCELEVGVRHGWTPLFGPLVADQVSRNRIDSLNWDNPLAVYATLIKQDAGLEVTVENFFDIAKSYPLGMQREGHEVIVRDPIAATEGGSLVCVGEVPEQSVLSLLKGDPDRLIEAARDAVERSKRSSSSTPDTVFVVDCISRSIFLDQRFAEELEAVAEGAAFSNVEPWGVLSLGEIASAATGPLEFYNKTIVVGALYGS